MEEVKEIYRDIEGVVVSEPGAEMEVISYQKKLEVMSEEDAEQYGYYDNQEFSEDNWNDYYGTLNRYPGFFSGFCYYTLDTQLWDYNYIKGSNFHSTHPQNASVLGFLPEGMLQSVIYTPWFNASEIKKIRRHQFDMSYFNLDMDINGKPRVFRVMDRYFDEMQIDKKVATVNLSSSSITEPKMMNYPFRYFTINDGMNPPLVIKPQYLSSTSTFDVKVKTVISDASNHLIYVPGYKKDTVGNIEGLINTASWDLPTYSNAYSTFMATSKAQHNTNYDYAHKQNTLQRSQNKTEGYASVFTNMASLAGSLLTAPMTGGMSLSGTAPALNGLINTGVKAVYDEKHYKLNKEQLEAEKLAMESDLRNAPHSANGSCNNVFFGMARFEGLRITEHRCEPQYWARAERYFKRFGIRVNGYKGGSNASLFRNRQSFNYIKMTTCNLMGATIPKEDLEGIKEIFEKGVTFWHVDRGASMYNYDVANNEV